MADNPNNNGQSDHLNSGNADLSFLDLLNAMVAPATQDSTAENRTNAGQTDESGNQSSSANQDDMGVSEESITTFLEFTGTADRERARLYLAGSDNLEQAVNLFLSGVPAERLTPPRRVQQQNSNVQMNPLPHLLRQAMSRTREGGAQSDAAEYSLNQLPQLAALLANLEGGGEESFLAELLPRGVRLGSLSGTGRRVELTDGSGNILVSRGHPIGEKNTMDDDFRAATKVGELRGGSWDCVPSIGDAIISSASEMENYLLADLSDVVSDALPAAMAAGDDTSAVRILQLLETVIRIMSDGHGPAALHCSGWFVTSRRSTRKYRRAPMIDHFMNRVVPVCDVPGLEQLWRDGFDPSWKDPDSGMDMLTYALRHGCSVEFIEFLVNPIQGCRAVVNTEVEHANAFGSPVFIAGTASCITATHLARDAGIAHEEPDHQAETGLPAPPGGASTVLTLEEYRDEWSFRVVELLIDAGAALGEFTEEQIESFTPRARELVRNELKSSGAHLIGKMRGKIFAAKTGLLKSEDVEFWWDKNSPKVFASLLRAIASSRTESTTHRAMEVLGIFIERWRLAPHYDVIQILEAGSGAASAAFMQLLQSLFTGENDDMTALLVAARIVNAILRVSTPPPGTMERMVSEQRARTLVGEEETTESHRSDLGTGEVEDDLADFHAQLCLGFCRFGVAHRLYELAFNVPQGPAKTAAQGSIGQGPPSPASMTTRAITQRTNQALAEESSEAIRQIRRIVVDVLGLGDETLHGVSPMLMRVCRGLHDGSKQALQELVRLLGRGSASGSAASEPFSQDTYFPSDDGITPFEFEQSGLAAALLQFLQVSSRPGGKQSVSTERLGQLLAAMPPPVAVPEPSTMGALDAIGAAYEDADEGDEGGELTQEAEPATEGEAKISTGEAPQWPGGEGSPRNGRGSPLSRGSASPTGNLPYVLQNGDSSGAIESGTVRALRALSFQFGSTQRPKGTGHTRRRSSLFGNGRSNSLTMDSIDLMDVVGQRNRSDSMKNSSPSALHRLIGKLQSVISIHAPHSFPVLTHEAPSSGGIRALVSPIKLRLRQDPYDVGSVCHNQATELVVQVLPLTPLRELELEVLRGVLVADPRYERYCRKLVGHKVRHRPAPSKSPMDSSEPTTAGSFTVSLVKAFDREFGAHKLRHLNTGEEQWAVMAVKEYQVLERVFEPEDLDESDSDTGFEDALSDPGQGRLLEATTPRPASSSLIPPEEDLFLPGSSVAVWWEGLGTRKPGWRSATVLSRQEPEENQGEEVTLDVQYDSSSFLEDLTVRCGDLVTLNSVAADVEAACTAAEVGWVPDMANYCGLTAAVTQVQGDKVTTNGLGGHTYPLVALTKHTGGDRDTLTGRRSRLPRLSISGGRFVEGEEVMLAPQSSDVHGLSPEQRGVVVADDRSRRPYQVRLPDGKTHWYTENDLVRAPDQAAGSNTENDLETSVERNVSLDRVCLQHQIANIDVDHTFAVVLEPNRKPTSGKQVSSKDMSQNGNTRSPKTVGVFEMNDRIEGRYGGRSRWYKGRISRVNIDGTYDIAYDDGDTERGVSAIHITHIGHAQSNIESFDFRKLFSNSIGRALFDALRREDSVLNTEYNFVTRGFEHQPKFYQIFSESLQNTGFGVFAQFQTREQAEILHDRISRVAQSSNSRSSVEPPLRPKVVLMPKSAQMPQSVEREVSVAFEKAAKQGFKHRNYPPPPGHRAQVDILGVDEFFAKRRKPKESENESSRSVREDASLVEDSGDGEGSDGEENSGPARWMSVTVIQLRKDSKGRKRYTIVLDDGTLLFGVPKRFLRMTQRTSRKFPFKPAFEEGVEVGSPSSPNMSPVAPRNSPIEQGSPRTLALELPPEPVELSRQFSAFGTRTAYKHIQVGEQNESTTAPTAIITVDGMVAEHPGSTVLGTDVNETHLAVSKRPSSAPEQLSGTPQQAFDLHRPPTFEVDFMVVPLSGKQIDDSDSDDAEKDSPFNPSASSTGWENGSRGRGVAISSGDGSDMSMFQSLYQLFHSDKSLVEMQSAGRTLATWSSEYRLQWRVRCVFPEDHDAWGADTVDEIQLDELDLNDGESLELPPSLPTPMVSSEWVQDKSLLPWKSPKELIAATKQTPCLTRTEFFTKLKPALADATGWANAHGLEAVATAEASEDQREVKRISWAEIAAAYAHLCGASLSLESPTRARYPLNACQFPGASPVQSARSSPCRSRGVQSPLRSPRRIPSHAFPEERNANVSDLLDICNVPPNHHSARDSLSLLKVLYDELVARYLEGGDDGDDDSGVSNLLGSTFARSLPWRNTVLSAQLREQLSDPLSIATRCFPRWVEVLPRMLSFLFRTKDRETHLRCTSLGISRAVAWLQDEITGYKAKKKQLAQVTLEMSAMFQGVPDIVRYERLQEVSDRLEDELRAIEQEHCIGHLHQDLVKVSRQNVLKDAEQLMKQHMRERSELVVQFLEESGTGDGVTLDFYASIAAKLQERIVNEETPMWVDGADPQRVFLNSMERNKAKEKSMQDSYVKDTEDATDSDSNKNMGNRTADEHITQQLGLFPAPLSPIEDSFYHGDEDDEYVRKARKLAMKRNKKVLGRFRFLGRLMAKAFLDGMHVPLPLSQEFFVLVKYRKRLALNSVIVVEGEVPGSSIENPSLLNGSTGENALIESNGLISVLIGLWKRGLKQDIAALEDRIDAAEIRFVDPTQLPFAPSVRSTGGNSANVQHDGVKLDELSRGDENKEEDGERECSSRQNTFKLPPVPDKTVGQEALGAYAQLASQSGMSKQEIDDSMAQAGHAKMSRWKALKSTQNIRTQIALTRATSAQSDLAKRSDDVRAAELCPGGYDRVVTMENVSEYLTLLANRWLEHGVLRQAQAFRNGLRDVLGTQGSTALLEDFSPSELRNVLCGKQQVHWDESDDLLGCLSPMGSYSPASPPVRMLVQALKEMSMQERSQFLSFTTSQPRVPLSGLPLIKVYPPPLTNVAGFTLASLGPPSGSGAVLRPGDTVVLADNFSQWEDALHGPLRPGVPALVDKVEGRVFVRGWWYNAHALKHLADGEGDQGATTDGATRVGEVLTPGAWVRAGQSMARVRSYNPETRECLFDLGTEQVERRGFKPGLSVRVLHGKSREEAAEVGELPRLTISHLTEQPDVIQMAPYLRPKATTCVKTLYLPDGYENHKHLLTVFRGAFEDAKLGGIQDG